MNSCQFGADWVAAKGCHEYLIWIQTCRYHGRVMTLEINGESRSIPPVTSLGELLAYLKIEQDRIAVEVNRRIVRRKDWEATSIKEMDRVEIVQFVGGG